MLPLDIGFENYDQNVDCFDAKDKIMDKKKKSKIPEFKSIAEEAAFWDTHDTTEFEDEFEDVEVEMPLLKYIKMRSAPLCPKAKQTVC
jgi:hypothetical protein